MVVANEGKFDTQMANSLKDLAAGNESYVIVSAIVDPVSGELSVSFVPRTII